MADKRVLVLKNDTLFMSAVLSFLSEQPRLEVLGIAPGDEEFYAKMWAFSPDVVVLAAETPDPGRSWSLSTILQSCPGVPVVALNESASDITTYREQRVNSATVADLLGIITGTISGSENPGEEEQ